FPPAAAGGAALLLACHPTVVEQLIIIAGRAEVMAYFFTVLTVWLLARPGPASFAGALASFILAMMSKETGIIAPLLALLLFYHRGTLRREWRRTLPFFLLIPLYLLLRRQALGGMPLTELGAAELALRAAARLPADIFHYLAAAVAPLDLHSHRARPEPGAWPAALFGLALAGGLFALARRGGRTALFLAGWYLVNLAPKVPLLLGNDLMLDHWVYGANLALFLWFSSWLNASFSPRAGKAALAGAALLLAAVGWLNISRRGDDLKIYEHALPRTFSAPLRYNLAREYFLRGDFARAEGLLEEILRRDPANAMYREGLAIARMNTGRAAEAAGMLAGAAAAGGYAPETLLNLSLALEKAGDPRAAEAAARRLTSEFADYPSGWKRLADTRMKAGDGKEARSSLEKALALDPYDAETLGKLGAVEAGDENYARAEELWRRALELDPGDVSLKKNLEKLDGLRRRSLPGDPRG
ncbi:MAG: tetratricopeptide repeat protein, partial [Elusimicrobiales bacterium]|nr:tetratricopeptide repeat protein [Elusimicrobiales bacterium]